MNNDSTNNNWFAGLLITAFIFLILGYTWRYIQEPLQYERGYVTGIEELSVVAREEICE